MFTRYIIYFEQFCHETITMLGQISEFNRKEIINQPLTINLKPFSLLLLQYLFV